MRRPGTHESLLKIPIRRKGGMGEDKNDTVTGLYADLWRTQMRGKAEDQGM